MFTGVIEEVGRVAAVRADNRSTRLQIAAPQSAKQTRSGDSIAVNGCCLTLASRRGSDLTFDLLEETIACTNRKILRTNDHVNLERHLRADGSFGGHYVY